MCPDARFKLLRVYQETRDQNQVQSTSIKQRRLTLRLKYQDFDCIAVVSQLDEVCQRLNQLGYNSHEETCVGDLVSLGAQFTFEN